jgi:hypothetical protein
MKRRSSSSVGLAALFLAGLALGAESSAKLPSASTSESTRLTQGAASSADAKTPPWRSETTCTPWYQRGACAPAQAREVRRCESRCCLTSDSVCIDSEPYLESRCVPDERARPQALGFP